MINYIWTILDVNIKNESIKDAKYHVTATSDQIEVQTEGNWYFNGSINKSFTDITEQDVIDLIRQESIRDGINIIESRLDEQLTYLANNRNETVAPWLPQTFTAN